MSDSKQILKFLKQLKQNNSREWMADHKEDYLQQKGAFIRIIQNLIDRISLFDPQLNVLEPKDCIFRINRDIRFSKDKTLYKTHFGAYLASGGRKSMLPGYYFHLEPYNKSFLAAGLYRPGGELLKKVRQEIDYNGHVLTSMVEEKQWLEEFGELKGEQLVKAPKGYSLDHPLIKYLQLKSYMSVLSRRDTEVTASGFVENVVQVFKRMNPLVTFLNTAIS